jgi:transposase
MEILTLTQKSEESTFLGSKKRRICPYQKVENEKRIRLCEMVLVNGYLLKNAAQELSINYSTAKTILRNFKMEKRAIKKTPNLSESTNIIKDELFNSEKLKEKNLIATVFMEKIKVKDGNRNEVEKLMKKLKQNITLSFGLYQEFFKQMGYFKNLVSVYFLYNNKRNIVE